MAIVLVVMLSAGFTQSNSDAKLETPTPIPTSMPSSVSVSAPVFQTDDDAITYNIKTLLIPIFGSGNVSVTAVTSEGEGIKVDVQITTGLSDPLTAESITAITQIVEGTVAGNSETVHVNVSEERSAD